MSHFAVVVIPPGKPRTRNDAKRVVADLLDRYDENKEMDEEHDEECYCIGRLAEKDVVVDKSSPWSNAKFGAIRNAYHEDPVVKARNQKLSAYEFRKPGEIVISKAEYRKLKDEADAAWKAATGAFFEGREAALNAHSKAKDPDPECESCDGTGSYKSDRNPESKWDWWVIGGRWTGSFDRGYDPRRDPANHEPCFICGGTGTRRDEIAIKQGGVREGYCNGCSHYLEYTGRPGVAVKFSYVPFDGDIGTVAAILAGAGVDEDEKAEDPSAIFIPFAIVTPDGEWHERGKMGWWAMVSEEKESVKWADEVRVIFEAHKDKVAILVDCHI